MNSNIKLEGIYTHLYKADDENITNEQFKVFEHITKDIDLSKIEIVHIPNSKYITTYKKKEYVNGCRMGIIMYGFDDKLNLDLLDYFIKKSQHHVSFFIHINVLS